MAKKPEKEPLTPQQRLRIAAEAQVSYNTVGRWARGERVQPISLYRINEALKVLDNRAEERKS